MTRLLPTISNPLAHFRLSSSIPSPSYSRALQEYSGGGSARARIGIDTSKTRSQKYQNSKSLVKSLVICVRCSTSEAEYLSYCLTTGGRARKAFRSYFSCLYALATSPTICRYLHTRQSAMIQVIADLGKLQDCTSDISWSTFRGLLVAWGRCF